MRCKGLLITALCCMIMCGCGQTDSAQTEQKELSAAEIVTTTAEKIVDTTVTDETAVTESVSHEYTDDDVNAAYNWLIGDVWNDGVREVRDVVKGTKTEEFDVDFCIANLKAVYAKRDEYNEIIHALDDSSEQAQLILAWDKSLEQADSLVGLLENGMPTADSFNCDLISQYSRKFYELYMDIATHGSSLTAEGSKEKFVFA